MVDSKYRDDGNGVYWDGPPEEEQAYLNDPARIKAELTAAVQNHLDATARTKNYDSGLSCASYAASTNPVFAAESAAYILWRDQVWSACYGVLADCSNNLRPVPTAAELIAELPPMVWP